MHIGLPKGRGLEYTRRACARLGVKIEDGVSRYETPGGVAVYILRFGDIARLLALGALDLGVTGDEWLLETGEPHEPTLRLAPIPIYTARLCLLLPDDPQDVHEITVVASPFPRLARRLVEGFSPRPQIISVQGTTEALVPGIADAAIDVVETGQSAKRHGLVVAADYGEVGACLASSRAFDLPRGGSLVASLACAER